jgi:hypothetical protein
MAYITSRAQREALLNLYRRMTKRQLARPTEAGYRAFRKSQCVPLCLSDCIMVGVWNMWIGIERDGYAHS